MIFYDKLILLFMYLKKKIKKKGFDEKFGTLGENDVIEKTADVIIFFLHQRVH